MHIVTFLYCDMSSYDLCLYVSIQGYPCQCGNREALRFKLDATCVWFSISTCHRRQGAGLRLYVTLNRCAPAL